MTDTRALREDRTWRCLACNGTCSVHHPDGDEPCPECDGQGRMRYCSECGLNPIPVDLIYCAPCLGKKLRPLP